MQPVILAFLQALSEWAALVADFQGRVSHPFSAAAAAEQGLLLLGRQAQGLTDPLRLDREEDELAGEGQVEDSMAAAADHAGGSKQRRDLAIEQLAADVRQEAPDLFHPDPVESSPGGSDRTSGSAAGRGAAQHERQQQQQQQQQRRRLQVLAEVLYRQHRLRYEPFEWVYDGLQPLLLPEVLKRRKGAPIVLAGLAAAVGRRLGLPLLPVPGESAEQAAASQQPSTAAAQQSELLSLELATRVATRTPATAPPPSSWVLLLLDPAWDGRLGTGAASGAGSHEDAGPSGGAAAGAVDCCYLDAASGALLDDAGVRAKYPTTQLASCWGGDLCLLSVSTSVPHEEWGGSPLQGAAQLLPCLSAGLLVVC